MNRAMTTVGLLILILGLTTAKTADAYGVGPSLSLNKLFEEADFVFKAVAVSSKPAADPWFDKVPGFEPHATELRIVTVYKGDAKVERVTFRHYSMNKQAAFNFMPQHYEFEVGRAYIVFVSKTDDPHVFRQLWKNHKSQEDQGQFLAGNEFPNTGTIKEVVLLELQRLLRSSNVADVKYAIRTLNTLSRADGDKAPDFSRNEVMAKMLPLLSHEDDTIATDTIIAIGSRNPYMRDDNSNACAWLASIGGGYIRGYSDWPNRDNETGRRYWRHLAEVVVSNAPVERRALALRALGLTRERYIIPLLKECLSSDEPLIVQAATVLLADYPYQFDLDEIKVLASDKRPLVRRGAAQVIGFGQIRPLVHLLNTLVNDEDPQVVQAAALSLLSFSLDDSRKFLEHNAKHPVFARLFVNALAYESPEKYLDELCQSIRTKELPKGWWGGYSVWGESWDILFEYVRNHAANLPAEKRDKLLDALEAPASGDKEVPHYFSSSEPRDLYALYIQKGMKDRAKAFRTQCKKGISYDMELYFNNVDANPSHFRRESR